jgi:hypothetical protein
MEEWQLSESEMKKMAVVTSDLREQLRSNALQSEMQDNKAFGRIEKQMSNLG